MSIHEAIWRSETEDTVTSFGITVPRKVYERLLSRAEHVRHLTGAPVAITLQELLATWDRATLEAVR